MTKVTVEQAIELLRQHDTLVQDKGREFYISIDNEQAESIANLIESLSREAELRPEVLEVAKELNRAIIIHAPMNSAHEGYAVILEEMDELKQHVWQKESKRNMDEMREEAKQIAAMGIRFMIDVCGRSDGR